MKHFTTALYRRDTSLGKVGAAEAFRSLGQLSRAIVDAGTKDLALQAVSWMREDAGLDKTLLKTKAKGVKQ